MRKELDDHYKAAKILAANKVKKTKTQINDIKNKFFNMDISQRMERVLRSRIRFLSLVAFFVALIALFFMFQEPLYLIVSLLTGMIAMIIDFLNHDVVLIFQ